MIRTPKADRRETTHAGRPILLFWAPSLWFLRLGLGEQFGEQSVECLRRESERDRPFRCFRRKKSGSDHIVEDASRCSFWKSGYARHISALKFAADERFFEQPSGPTGADRGSG